MLGGSRGKIKARPGTAGRAVRDAPAGGLLDAPPGAVCKMNRMVTGFNTDVEHDGRLYHVQTEDKGVDNPIIETLVYRGGEILAARRSSYADLKRVDLDEAVVARRIETQHNQVIADVRAGRFEVKRARPFGEGIVSNRSFDEVVLDFLRSEMGPDPLVVSVVRPAALAAGTAGRLEVLVTRAHSGDGVRDAEVRVRLITTAGRPQALGQGKTDESGLATLDLSIPGIGRGSAALVVQALAGKDSAETRQAVAPAAGPAGGA